MINLKGVSKIYRINDISFHALDHVNLEINDGEMIAIQGRSGAGKSTLLHILGCLDTFDTGTYTLNSIDIGSQSTAKLAHIRNSTIGFVLQDFSLINHKTALYNVKAPMLFNKTPFFEMKKKAMGALYDMGIPEQAEKDVLKMSGGQRQRVAIARAIVNDTPVILADEPTGNLDSTTADEIMQIFVKLHKQGKTIIIVTHDDHIASFCDRIIKISDGKIV
ncbi:MAG: ABC transporter ATP-binding protein [Clostridiales bacterium GWF2_38_85]|nr:MAG: ABC transporter ATP-binding protein [Clostridiales bacterium GWF2_38_85]HBL85202.1 ABC transporter ATP-binding protein [Clostridiales bacterium]